MATPTSTIATPKFYMDKFSKKEAATSRSSSSRSSSSTTTTPLMKSNSLHAHDRKRCCVGFSRKCARLVKQQRARFYIMRRCVTMLICWRDYADS